MGHLEAQRIRLSVYKKAVVVSIRIETTTQKAFHPVVS
jgi:hypothetical protein